MLVGVTLNDNEATHMWKPEASGLFSTRSAYRSFFFIGSITFEPWNKVRKSWAPGKCKTFVWLAIRNLVGLIVYKKEVFLILSVALYDQEEKIQHSSSHVFLQGNSGMPSCSP